jgi:hypothetical protein
MQRREKLAVGIMAGICLTAATILLPKLELMQFTPAAAATQELLRVKIHRLTIDPSSGQPVVLLSDPQEERALPIWIGPFEANAMNQEMEGTKPPRPQTHDLLERVIKEMKGKIQKVIVTHSQGGVYYATLVLEREGMAIEIDARPSDSLVLALKAKAPIWVGKKMFQEASVPLKEAKGVEDQYGITAQELTSSLAQSFSYKSTRGVLVSDVRSGSLAEKDGLQRGDILVEMEGEVIPHVNGLKVAMNKAKGPVKAKVFRKGEYVSLTIHGK